MPIKQQTPSSQNYKLSRDVLVRSVGVSSDILVMRGLSEVEDHADRIVVRTPSEPDYWFGNMVIFRTNEALPEAQIDRFRADFPTAGHVTLGWDAPNMVRGEEHDRLAAMGFDISQTDVLTLKGPLNRASGPAKIAVRPIQTDPEWEQVIALQVEIRVEEGRSHDECTPFVRNRFSNRRRQIEEGWACWFGAFDGDFLVGDMGVFMGDRLARYQDVETRASHRRQGICAELVTAAADWARRNDPGIVPVVQANSRGNAGRVYRRCGFAHTETLVSAVKGSASGN